MKLLDSNKLERWVINAKSSVVFLSDEIKIFVSAAMFEFNMRKLGQYVPLKRLNRELHAPNLIC